MITVAGEALIDLVARDGSLYPIPGGGPFNTAVALARLDVPTSFLGRVSTDRLGRLLAAELERSGVDDRHLLRGSAPTPLAVVDTSESGDAEYTFYLASTAYADLMPSDLPELGDEVSCLHLGTLGLATDPPTAAYELLLERESARRLVVVDPNVRPDVIADANGYRRRFESWLGRVHVLKASAFDVEWLYPGLAAESFAERMLERGARIAVVTRGAEGAIALTGAGSARVEALEVEVVDTVGAGDAFGAGLLRRLWESDRLDPNAVGRMDDAELEDVLRFASAVSALQYSRAGAAPPTLAEVSAFAATRT
jgi:fructokinase